jgi:hypothetical protein
MKFDYPEDWHKGIEKYDYEQDGTEPIMRAGLILLDLARQLSMEMQATPAQASAMLAFACMALMKCHPQLDFAGLLAVMKHDYDQLPDFSSEDPLATLKTSYKVH